MLETGSVDALTPHNIQVVRGQCVNTPCEVSIGVHGVQHYLFGKLTITLILLFCFFSNKGNY